MLQNIFHKSKLAGSAAAVMMMAGAMMTSSCDSMIYDDQGDCTVHYRVPFTFTMNTLEVDAFPTQVRSVTLHVFDRQGNLVLSKTDSGDALSQPDYRMDVDLLPGTYDMLAWAEGPTPEGAHTAFTMGQGSRQEDFDAKLPLLGTAPGLYSDLEVTPLFHGEASGVVCIQEDFGYIDLPTIDLTRDTNTFTLILNNVDGRVMDESDFTITITDSNSELDWQNAVVSGTQSFDYRPFASSAISTAPAAAPARADGDGGGQTVTGLISEISMGRLMATAHPQLTVVRNLDGAELFSFDLMEYLLMYKGAVNRYSRWTAQEYLDRMDEYSMTFFLDDKLDWYTAAGIYVLSWHIVPPQNEEL